MFHVPCIHRKFWLESQKTETNTSKHSCRCNVLQRVNVSDGTNRVVWYKLIHILNCYNSFGFTFRCFQFNFYFFPEYTKMKRESGLTALDTEFSCAAEKSIISFEEETEHIHWMASWFLFYLRLFETEWNWIKPKWLKQAKCTKDDLFKWLYKCMVLPTGIWHGIFLYSRLFSSLYIHTADCIITIFEWFECVCIDAFYQNWITNRSECWCRQTIIFSYNNIINTKKFSDDWVCMQPATSINSFFVVYVRKPY